MKKYILVLMNVVTRFFTGLTVAIALILTIADLEPSHHQSTVILSETQILKIFVLALVLGLITVLRESLETQKWMLRLSFIQRRYIFFPLYLTATLFFLYQYGILETFGLQETVLYSSVFLICASLNTAVMNKKYKAEKQQLTASVSQYQNKLEKNRRWETAMIEKETP